MSVNISQETQDKISALCKKISVAHNLDEEIQKELRCHIEDRLTGYLSGDEQLTEDDAFILVEKHFGDPATVKALYQNVEAMATHASIARRVGTLISASLGAGILYWFEAFDLKKIIYWKKYLPQRHDLGTEHILSLIY